MLTEALAYYKRYAEKEEVLQGTNVRTALDKITPEIQLTYEFAACILKGVL